MQQALSGIDFAPVLPVWLIAALAVLAVLALVPALLRRARGAALRALTFALLLLALANPRLVEETRETRPDIALLVVDRSDSARIGNRAQQIEAARAGIEARMAKLPDLELRTIEVPEGGNQGTRLFTATERALADIPRARLAGVIALTDGQVHDAPAAAPVEAPVHALLPGRPGETDRRLRMVEAPGFGIVGRSVELRVAVEDLGVPNATGAARLSIRRDGAAPRVESVPIGREHRISIPIERGGPTVVELAAEARPGEVSELNNRAVVTITGVRDRLRVLLVSGEPHAGERTWRRLLKADPGVDLVHFTILRPPEKDDLTPLNELALIAFPVRELFQVKIRDFDLIILDRFQNRGILPPTYLRNIADYVRSGGGLLLSAGPEFASPASLSATALGGVLPAHPSLAGAGVTEGGFRPQVTPLGSRHPVTEGLPGSRAPGVEPTWGPWYRRIDVISPGGQDLMDAPDGAPLLLLDHVEQGRVAMLLSDQIWLWSRGHQGGGPQAELLRRIAHWLMKEPALEEEALRARIEGGQLLVERRSVGDGPPGEVSVTSPTGVVTRLPLRPDGPGRGAAELPAANLGVWQVTDGARTTFAATVNANPREIADLRATGTVLSAAARASGGGVHFIGAGTPELRRVEPGRDASGAGWVGLVRRHDHIVTGVDATPLLPPWAALPLLLGLVLLAWRREGSG